MKGRQAGSFFQRHANPFLYVPNLIGYTRVALAFASFAVALKHPGRAFIFYFLSFVCDELDGRFARMLDQTSKLGAVLDMVTDRLSTAGLLCVLCILYPWLHVLFLGLLWLDVFSHWFQTHSTVAAGAATHKDVNSSSWLVRSYYQHRLFMGYCCVSCEVLYLMVYLLRFDAYRAWPAVDLGLGPTALDALPQALQGLIPQGRAPLALLVALPCLPGFVIKQITNCFQLRVAMTSLAEHDAAGSGAKRN